MQLNNYEFLTSDQELINTDYYKEISSVLTGMIKSDTVRLTTGWCISSSNIIYLALQQRGIKCQIIEVELLITYNTIGKGTQQCFIGFENIKSPGEIDTHVVILTKTPVPILIDASISDKISLFTPVVIERAESLPDRIIGLYSYQKDNLNLKLLYKQKENQKVGEIYFKSFVDRINTDKEIFKNLNLLKLLVTIALVIGGLNLIRGAYDFYETFVNDENYWGPTSIEKILKDEKK
jgi:hypothetical protein